MFTQDAFPLRDINPDEVAQIREIFGRPVPNPDFVRHFIEVGGRPLLKENERMLRFMWLTAKGASDYLDVPHDESSRAITAGGMLYAGVYQYFNTKSTLQIRTEAISAIEDLEMDDVILAARDNIRKEGKNFLGLLEAVAPAMQVERRYMELAQIGAGALHLVVHEEDRQTASLFDYEQDPDLADLQEMFKALGS